MNKLGRCPVCGAIIRPEAFMCARHAGAMMCDACNPEDEPMKLPFGDLCALVMGSMEVQRSALPVGELLTIATVGTPETTGDGTLRVRVRLTRGDHAWERRFILHYDATTGGFHDPNGRAILRSPETESLDLWYPSPGDRWVGPGGCWTIDADGNERRVS